jgi:replicative DNA helicase
MALSDKQRSRKHRLISYLLDNDVPARNRLQIAYELENRFPCEDHYRIVPKVIELLESDTAETPPIDYFVEDYDYDCFTDVTDTPADASARDLLEQDYNTYIKNDLIQIMSWYLDKDVTEVDAEEMILELRKRIDRYESKIDLRELETLRDLYEHRKNKQTGLNSFVDPIDERISSFELGTMSTLLGESGEFKTTLALAKMYNNILHNNKNCVFISLEMDRDLIMFMLQARHSFNKMFADQYPPVTFEMLRDGEVTGEYEDFIMDTVWDDLKNNDTYGDFVILGYDDFMDFTESGIRSRLSRLDFDVDGVFVDYIQELKYEDHPFDSYNTDPINHYARAFSKITDDCNGTGKKCHVTLLSQVNKQGYAEAKQRKGKYSKDAIAEAHTVKRESSFIWSTYANDEHKQMGQTRVMLIKNRYGEEMNEPETINIDPGMIYTGDDEEDIDGTNVDVDDIF